MINRNDARMRDPFVVLWNDTYYVYGTYIEGTGNANEDAAHIFVYKSKDMKVFENAKSVFHLSDNVLWAPEVHLYKGKFYLFVSIIRSNGLRGVQIAVSDTPDGLFLPISDEVGTPLSQSCIDGTLYVENGVPYHVYSHDWPDCYNAEKDCYVGEICVIQMTDDLKETVGEPFVLFKSDEISTSAGKPSKNRLNGKNVLRYGSDGPFIKKLKNGTLFLIWSPYPNSEKYVICSAISKNGSIFGKWEHNPNYLFDENGGHGMFFTDRDGMEKLVLHIEPEPKERIRVLEIEEHDNEIRILREC